MAYGSLKVDNIIFTNGGVDQTVTVSGIVQSISGNITATGTIQGATIIGTSTVSGATVTGNVGVFTAITGGTAGFTTVTGATVTGTTANFGGVITAPTIRGTTTVSGATVTGTAGQFTTVTGGSAGFTTVTGTTVTGTTANFATLSGTTITGGHVTTASGTYTGNVTAAAFVPTGSSVPTNGVYLPSANNVAISSNGVGRLFIDASGNVGVGGNPAHLIHAYSTGNGTYLKLTATDATGNGDRTITIAADRPGVAYHNLAFSAESYQFGVSGSERMRLTATGLGLGTSAPVSPCHIEGVEGAAQLTISNTNQATSDGDFVAGIDFLIKDNNDATGAVCTSIRSIADQNHTLTAKGTALALYTTPDDTTTLTERLRIDQAGRVGIGTTSPAFGVGDGLEVARSGVSTIRVSSNTQGVELRSDAGTGTLETRGAFPLLFGIQGTERARIDSSGRLLVGTSSAPQSYDGASLTGLQIEKSGSTATRSLALVSNAISNFPASLHFGRSRGTTNGAVSAVINNDGLGGITFGGADGTTAFIPAASISAAVDGTPGANDMPGRLVFSTTADGASSPTERMRVRSDGSVCLGKGIALGDGNRDVTTSIYIGGTVIASGAGNSTLKYSTSSGLVTYDTSSRLVKENIEDCPYGAAEIKLLKPRKYFRTDDQREEIGFVADELVTVLPEFVPIGPKSVITKNDQDTEEIPLGVNYEKLTAVLTAALQEALAEIESLKARVTALEA